MKLHLVACVLACAACSSSSSSPVATNDPDAAAPTANDGGAGSGACNAIVQHGPDAEIYETSTTPFVATYGTILDGTYMLTSGQHWAKGNIDEIGDDIAKEKGTIEITGDVMQTVTTTDTTETRTTLQMTTTNSDILTLTSTCQSPAGDAGTIAAMAGTYKWLVSTDEIILELQLTDGSVLTERFTRM